MRFHIRGRNNILTLEDTIDFLEAINKDIKDYLFLNNYELNDFKPVIENVEKGSIILDIFIGTVTSVISTSLIDLIKLAYCKKHKTKVTKIKITQKNSEIIMEVQEEYGK